MLAEGPWPGLRPEAQRPECVRRVPLQTPLLCPGRRDRDHVEAGGQGLAVFLAPVPSCQLLHLFEEALESGGMMHHQNRGALLARIVKTVDGLARDKSEGARGSDVLIIADTQHQLAGEDVEELVPFAMIVWPCSHRARPDAPFPNGAEAVSLGLGDLHGDARTRRPDRNEPPNARSHYNCSHLVHPFATWTIIAALWPPAAGLRQGHVPSGVQRRQPPCASSSRRGRHAGSLAPR